MRIFVVRNPNSSSPKQPLTFSIEDKYMTKDIICDLQTLTTETFHLIYFFEIYT